MCGFLGVVGWPDPPQRALEALMARGPDALSRTDRGAMRIWHSLLSIVRPDGAPVSQPITAAGLSLICNGFVSNYEELRKARGGATRSDGDCAEIAYAYRRGGAQALAELRGQFAFALWDDTTGELILGRDASGIVPLYYSRPAAGALTFGSQARLLIETNSVNGEWRPRIRSTAKDALDALGYVIFPQTLLAGIYDVPPGSILRFGLGNTQINGASMFTPASRQRTAEPVEFLTEALLAAVKRNMRGDVEPWLLLSGGIDSSALLFACAALGLRPRCVALRYPDNSNADELLRAQEATVHVGADLEIVDAPEVSTQLLADIVAQQADWPLDGGSLVPKAMVARHIQARGGRLALGGTGADELFGGYSRHRAAVEAPNAPYTDAWGRAYVLSVTRGTLFRQVARSLNWADPRFIFDYLEVTQVHTKRVDAIFANMAIEYRPPFLDFDIVSLAAALPLEARTSAETPKRLLRDAAAAFTPRRFLDVQKRPLRFGQMAPSRAWRAQVFETWSHAVLGAAGDVNTAQVVGDR